MNPNFLATATKTLSEQFMKIERIADGRVLGELKKISTISIVDNTTNEEKTK